MASGLFALISLILAGLIVQEMRFCTRASRRLEVEREQMLLEENLRQDLMSTAAAGITVEPSAKAFALQPVEDVGLDGFLVFSTRRLIVYRYESDQMLHRYAWKLKPLAFVLQQKPVRLTAQDWAGLLTKPPDRDSHWTRLKSFRVHGDAGADDVTQRLSFEMIWQEENGPRSTRSCYFTRQNP